jgi:hypothetical protein
MERLRYTPSERNQDPDRQLELRYIPVYYPTPSYVLAKTDSVRPVWLFLRSLGFTVYRDMITGANYKTRVSDSKSMRAINLTFDSVETRNKFLKAYKKIGKQPGGIELTEAVRRIHPHTRYQASSAYPPLNSAVLTEVVGPLEEIESQPVVSISGLIEETDSAAEAEDNIVLDNDVSFSDSDEEEKQKQKEALRVHLNKVQNKGLREHLNKVKCKDIRKHLNRVIPELEPSHAKELAAEIARGGSITVPQKQMEENILRKIQEIRRENDMNKARQIQETMRDNRLGHRPSRLRGDSLEEDVKNSMRRKACEEVNKAYERLRDQNYKHKVPVSESLRARLGSKIDEEAGAQEHKHDKKPALSRLGKKITSLSEDKPANLDADEEDNNSESESDEPGEGKGPSRGSR